jgi:hypothetical protein
MNLIRYCIVNTDTNLVENIVDYETEQSGVPPGFPDNYLCVQSNTGEIGATYKDGVIVNPLPPAPTPDQLLENCKAQASSLLYATDWTQIPDVASPDLTPHLLNMQEFNAYRNAVRKLAVNPVVDPIFPDKPVAQWSSS